VAVMADPALRDLVSPFRRSWWLSGEHAALIAVAVAYGLVVVLRTSQTMSLTFDEVVYASQLGTDTPAVRFSAPRARGMTLLVAPVVTITESVLMLRAYLTILSGVLMYVAFRPWLSLFQRAGDRYRYLPAVAAGLFATLWTTVLYGNLSYPNLWLGFALVAGVGYFFRASSEPAPAWGPVAGVAAAFAAASLIRPTDALAVALPLMFVPLVVMAWLRLEPLVAMLVGLLVGWSAWVGEAYARFGGPIQRLRDGSETNQGGLVNSVPEHIDALDGPSVLCRPHDVCAGIEPGAAVWWFVLPVLAAVGLVAARRHRWFAVGAFTAASAATFTLPYLFLIDYSAARFLIPTYGLLAIPAAGALLWLTGLGDRPIRTGVSIVVVVLLLLHVAVQQDLLGTVRDRQEGIAREYEAMADFLREAQGVRAPCLVWGEGVIQLAYPLKCRSVWVAGGAAPIENDPVITAALARGEDVVVRIRADEEVPAFMAGWRRVELPGSDVFVGYLPPDGR
jgi:hypothetical protein